MRSPMMVLGAVACMLLPHASAQTTGRQPMRDVVTHDDIVESTRKAKKETPPPAFKPLEGTDPSVANRPKDLLSRSSIFSYLGKATLVPKRAVLHLPKELADRATLKEQSTFISWADFYAANRAWIRTVTVTRTQAEGRQAMDPETVKSFEKERRLVVATYQEGPISVNPYQAPPAETAAVPGKTTSIPVAKP